MTKLVVEGGTRDEIAESVLVVIHITQKEQALRDYMRWRLREMKKMKGGVKEAAKFALASGVLSSKRHALLHR